MYPIIGTSNGQDYRGFAIIFNYIAQVIDMAGDVDEHGAVLIILYSPALSCVTFFID